jgi:hypothetical protein
LGWLSKRFKALLVGLVWLSKRCWLLLVGLVIKAFDRNPLIKSRLMRIYNGLAKLGQKKGSLDRKREV